MPEPATEPLSITLPYVEGDKRDLRNDLRREMFKAALNASAPYGDALDLNEVINACWDIASHILAHGPEAQSPEAAGAYAAKLTDCLRQRMLLRRREIDRGTSPPLPNLILVPTGPLN